MNSQKEIINIESGNRKRKDKSVKHSLARSKSNHEMTIQNKKNNNKYNFKIGK